MFFVVLQQNELKDCKFIGREFTNRELGQKFDNQKKSTSNSATATSIDSAFEKQTARGLKQNKISNCLISFQPLKGSNQKRNNS